MRRRENFWRWLAWRVPRRLAYWCALRIVANATTGVYGRQHPDALLAMDALERWDKPGGGDPTSRRHRQVA